MATASLLRPAIARTPLPRDPVSPRRARLWTRATLCRWGITGPPADEVVLVVSELVTNAYQHACGPIHISVAHLPDGSLQVTVRDQGPARRLQPQPQPQSQPGAPEEHGRGLLITAALATACGHSLDEQGHRTVWATLGSRPPDRGDGAGLGAT
ncbi:ATP-binding protein [Streptacidiphilus sp. PAMC 29251]